MKIGELAQKTNTAVETIRYYERVQLLPVPKRKENNYRIYTNFHLERLRFIRNCRSLDMTHEEIRTLLYYLDAPSDNCETLTALIDAHLRHVDVLLKEINKLSAQ